MLVFLKYILTRTFIFYLACFFLIWLVLDYHQLVDNAVPQTMSRLTPPMDYYVEFVDKEDHYDRFKLMNCVNYHKAVADFFVIQKAEAYGMLGFCYERLGQEPQAVSSYRQAIALNPDYFWPYYDLGVIYYKQARYAQAEDYFQRGLEQDPVKTLVLLSRSKVYNDVRLSKQSGTYDFLQGLKQGRTKAYILLMDSLFKTGAYDQLWKTALYGLKEDLDMQGIFYYYAGVAAFYLKSYKQAIELLQIAIQNDPENADALMFMGMCLHLANKDDIAQIMMRKAALIHGQEGAAGAPYLKARVRFF
jgi:tetratricopeptide (TPR) repeat protein